MSEVGDSGPTSDMAGTSLVSHEPTFGALQTTSQFGTHVTSVDVVEGINARCTSLATIWALSVPTAGVILLVSLMQLR